MGANLYLYFHKLNSNHTSPNLDSETSHLRDLHAGLGVIPRLLDIPDGILGVLDPDVGLDDGALLRTAAALGKDVAAHRESTHEGRVGPVAASKAELGVDLNNFSLSAVQPSTQVIAAGCLVADAVKHGIIKVDDIDVILSTEVAAA